MDPTIATALAQALTLASNKALQFDPGTRYALERMGNTTLKLSSLSPTFNLYCHTEKQQLRFSAGNDDANNPPAATLRGSASDFVQYLFTAKKSLAGTGIEVEGKLATLEALRDVFSQLDIDWEGMLADHLGDLAGHELARVMRFVRDGLQEVKENLQARLEPTLTDELELLAHSEEVHEFVENVEALRSHSERLARRIQALCIKVSKRRE